MIFNVHTNTDCVTMVIMKVLICYLLNYSLQIFICLKINLNSDSDAEGYQYINGTLRNYNDFEYRYNYCRMITEHHNVSSEDSITV